MKPSLTPCHTVTSGEIAGTTYTVYASEADDAHAPVVLIHGVGMNQSVWTSQIGPITTANHRVVVYDMLGHGSSALPPADATLEDYAAQLERLLDGLHIERAHVVGHSMGALVALEFALTRPQRTISVSALNAVYDRTPAQREAVMSRAATLDDAPVDTGVDATIERWFGQPVPPHLSEASQAVRQLLLSVNPAGYARTYRLFARSDDVHVGLLESLSMPALFLTGERDPNSSPEMSQAMAKAAPLGQVEVIADARHMMNVSDPMQVNARLLAFFAKAGEQQATNTPNTGERHV